MPLKPRSLPRLFGGLVVAIVTSGLLSTAVPSPQSAAAATAAARPSVRYGSLDVAGWDDGLVGEARPRFSWVMENSGRGEFQTAYRIEVQDARSEVVWDSGEVASRETTLRPYGGTALAAGTDYTWRVRVRNKDGNRSGWSEPSKLSTGLFDLSDWHASWLAVPDRQRARTEFPLAGPVRKAVLYLAAQGSVVARINGKPVSDEVLGSTWTDWGQRTLYRGVDVTKLVKTGANALGLTVTAGHTQEGAPTINAMAQLDVVDNRGVRRTLVSTGAGWRTAPSPLTRVDPYRGESVDARLETKGWDKPGFNDASWTAAKVTAPVVGAPLLSTASRVVASAKDDVACCGWSASALNDGVLSSQTARDHPQGYHSTLSSTPDEQKWAQLDLGAEHRIGSVELYPASPTNDPEGSFPGAGFPVRYRVEGSNDPTFATSEVLVDRTAEDQPNPGTSPVVLPVQATARHRYVRVIATKLRQTKSSFDFRLAELLVRGRADEPGWALTKLEADPTPPMRVVQTVSPVSSKTVAPGVQLFDFGQNYAGWVQLTASAPTGTQARVYAGEVLDAAGRVTTANLDFAPGEEPRQDYRYTFSGTGTETWEPQFVYAGFRYAEVSGLPAGTELTVRARVVHTDLQGKAELDLGDPVLQRISAAIQRTQLNAMHGLPEDTPTREKKGWTGDALSGVSSIMTTFDADTLYRKYLGDIQTSLSPAGGVSSVVPSRGFGATYKVDPAWGSAYPVIVWTHYLQQGDPAVLRQHYDDLARWVGYLATVADGDHIVVRPETSWGNDWLSIQSTPPELFHTGYYLRSVRILADISRALDRTADAARYDVLAAAIGDGLNRRFLSRDTASYANGSQFANAFPLLLGVVPAELKDRVLQNLIGDIRAKGNHLTSGFVGTQPIIQTLHAYGRDDVVLDLAEREDYPSLGYMVANGPGTIWERWDKTQAPEGTSSKDHPALGGGMEEWFYQGLAGIQPLEPGYRKVSLAVPDLPDHDHAAASVETPLGTVTSDWTRTESSLTHRVEIPVGATAEVRLPTTNPAAISERGHPLDRTDGVQQVVTKDGHVVVTVGSGTYDFTVTR
ncbi:family 78 glycoside hydrolase catalytic domain [Kribbella sp. NPDC056861]|uniref:family 78 glycoside hydrolase catalytic domain n=1 Tax=Kribbella sp. NPDC056861 TaxID=3154857 RepID=UPI00341FBD9E